MSHPSTNREALWLKRRWNNIHRNFLLYNDLVFSKTVLISHNVLSCGLFMFFVFFIQINVYQEVSYSKFCWDCQWALGHGIGIITSHLNCCRSPKKKTKEFVGTGLGWVLQYMKDPLLLCSCYWGIKFSPSNKGYNAAIPSSGLKLII